MTVYYRGPDTRRPDVVITDRLIKVRVSRGWRVWIIAEMRDIGVVHTNPAAGPAMWAVGTSVILVGVLAHRLRGWALLAAAAVFLVAVVAAVVERRLARSRAPSQLRATYRGVEVVVLELPQRHFDAACRGLTRAIEHGDDTQ